jgi:hypothetical protein
MWELETLGVPRVAFQRAVDRGQVGHRARGIYVKPDHATTRHATVATLTAQSPKAIVCLVSALEYHGLTTQVPHAVWIMIDKSAYCLTVTSSAAPARSGSGSSTFVKRLAIIPPPPAVVVETLPRAPRPQAPARSPSAQARA